MALLSISRVAADNVASGWRRVPSRSLTYNVFLLIFHGLYTDHDIFGIRHLFLKYQFTGRGLLILLEMELG